MVAVGLLSLPVFVGYGLLFSNPRIVAIYVRLRRWFEAVFAMAFGLAGAKLLSPGL
ncbi:hypothetical protein [Hoeflea ulvae]|uniref:Lysine transporter LysE n=1 Tax=Hoeflea ulvae TaxID=2983764 RepID=A0ABT3YL85_9HYPH|nr:hypothetical protein [Hoeflea ulvae]MCY0096637.1 hypothetical protein [Hoeflea ulvae]